MLISDSSIKCKDKSPNSPVSLRQYQDALPTPSHLPSDGVGNSTSRVREATQKQSILEHRHISRSALEEQSRGGEPQANV